MLDLPDHLTTPQAAALTGLSESWLTDARRSGGTAGPPTVKKAGRVLYPLAALQEWMRLRLLAPSPERLYRLGFRVYARAHPEILGPLTPEVNGQAGGAA